MSTAIEELLRCFNYTYLPASLLEATKPFRDAAYALVDGAHESLDRLKNQLEAQQQSEGWTLGHREREASLAKVRSAIEILEFAVPDHSMLGAVRCLLEASDCAIRAAWTALPPQRVRGYEAVPPDWEPIGPSPDWDGSDR